MTAPIGTMAAILNIAGIDLSDDWACAAHLAQSGFAGEDLPMLVPHAQALARKWRLA